MRFARWFGLSVLSPGVLLCFATRACSCARVHVCHVQRRDRARGTCAGLAVIWTCAPSRNPACDHTWCVSDPVVAAGLRSRRRSPTSRSRSRSRGRHSRGRVGNHGSVSDDEDFDGEDDGNLSDGMFDGAESPTRRGGIASRQPERRAVKLGHPGAGAGVGVGVGPGGGSGQHKGSPAMAGPAPSSATTAAGGVAAGADTLKLGTFMYARNVKWSKESHSTDSPKYWVGRVAEIIRGGRVRLHWHRYCNCMAIGWVAWSVVDDCPGAGLPPHTCGPPCVCGMLGVVVAVSAGSNVWGRACTSPPTTFLWRRETS